MATRTSSVLLPAAYGWLAGMRSISAPAAAGLWLGRNRWRRGRWARALTTPGARRALPALALVEFGVDKWRGAPDRTHPVLLVGRLAAGALAGAAASEALRGRRAAGVGAAIGAASALASSFVGLRLRRAASRRLGTSARAGFAEDALSLGLGAALARA